MQQPFQDLYADLPPPPVFGTSSVGTFGKTNSISLDDVFQDAFFSEDGELLDIGPSDEAQPPPTQSTIVQQQEQPYQSMPIGLGSTAVGSNLLQQQQQPLQTAPSALTSSLYAGAPAAAAPAPQRTAPQQQYHTMGVTAAAAAGLLTEEQKLERRERNREHAKRSRVRKKFLLESLQRSVDALQSENDSLKDSIREHMGEQGEALLEKCTPAADSLLTSNPARASRILDDPDYSLVKALQTAQQNFVITDANLPDNPIVYASGGFLTLTGYKLDQILGRNCRFLQGPETDPRAVDKIRSAIAKGEDTSVCLLNYRQDGSTFWNQFFVAGLRDAQGHTVNYVGVQSKVSEEYAQLVVEQQNLEFKEGKAAAAAAAAGYRRK